MPSFFFSTSHLTVDSISYWILITYILCGVRYPTSLTPHSCNDMKYSELHGFRVAWGRKRKFKDYGLLLVSVFCIMQRTPLYDCKDTTFSQISHRL